MMNDLSPGTLLSDYESGKRTPRDVLEGVYAQIERLGERPVWIHVVPLETALATLKEVESRGTRGKLHGVPFAVKDNIDVAGLPTTAACPDFSYIPDASAQVVQRLTEAGAVVIGKTNLDQFATGLVGSRSPYGACSSVFDARYISGGSSSGSAVAVARGDVSFALGTDTAGSGRVPAAFNDLVGFKPTRGLLSNRGVVPACRSLDCVSLFTKNVADAARVLDVASGFDPLDPFSRSPIFNAPLTGPPRLGVPSQESLEFFGDRESERLFAAAVERARALAADLVTVDLAPFREAASLLYDGPWVAERLAAIGDFFELRPEALEPVLRSILAGARRFSARDAFVGAYRLEALRRATQPVWSRIDALLLPTAPTHYTLDEVLAAPVALNQNLGTYTNFVNLLDLSAIAVPTGFRENGLPFGVTFVAPAFCDARLIELGALWLDESAPARADRPEPRVLLAVAGAHLSGQPLNHELTSRGARLIRTARTARAYRLYALATQPPKPGLVHAPSGPGYSLEVELWELDERAFGSFVAAIPAPMTIGSLVLEDGSRVRGFSCEPFAIEGAQEISEYGGWRGYLAARSALH